MPDATEFADRAVALAAELGIPLTEWQAQLLRELFAVGPDGQFKQHPLTGYSRGEIGREVRRQICREEGCKLIETTRLDELDRTFRCGRCGETRTTKR